MWKETFFQGENRRPLTFSNFYATFLFRKKKVNVTLNFFSLIYPQAVGLQRTLVCRYLLVIIERAEGNLGVLPGHERCAVGKFVSARSRAIMALLS
jgi:hypothetical protein